MNFHNRTGLPHRQRSTFPSFLPDILPEARVIKGLDLTAKELSRALGGREAGDEWGNEGYVVGDEAWIDDRDSGGIYIRCEDIKGLLRRAIARLGTPDAIVRRYAPTLRLYVNAPVAQGKRSDVIFKIGATLHDRGASAAEIECVLASSRCAQSKYSGRAGALKREVERIMRKSHGRN